MAVKFLITIGVLLVLIGLFFNQWTINYFLTPNGNLSIYTISLIWLFDISCVCIGFVFLSRRNTWKIKQCCFFLFSIIFFLIVIETALHLIEYISNSFNTPSIDKRLSLSVYENKKWAEEYWNEYKESFSNGFFRSYLDFDLKPYEGKWINIDKNGNRKTWNPAFSDKDDFKTLYTFGGSTLWGVGARDDYTIPSHLSKLLNQNGSNFIVKNFGEQTYTFTKELIQLILLLRKGHTPDFLIFYDGVNDVYEAYQTKKAGEFYIEKLINEKLEQKIKLINLAKLKDFPEKLIIVRIIAKLITYFKPQEKFQEAASKFSDEELNSLSQEIGDYYKASYKMLDTLSKAYNFQYLCFWQPVFFTESNFTKEEAMCDIRCSDTTLKSLFKKTNNILMDNLYPNFYNISDCLTKRENSFYIDCNHLSEEGNSVVAKKIFTILDNQYLKKD